MDINCAVCAEPWDVHGVTHGDMFPWEAKLFRLGAGCPHCQGKAPAGVDGIEEHLRSIVDNSEDPDSFPLLHNPTASRPAWERPADEVVFSCAGCDSKILRDADTGDLAWSTPTVDRYYYHRPNGHNWTLNVDDLPEIDGERYCLACADFCDECSDPVFSSDTSCTGTVLYGDTYDPGCSHPAPDSGGEKTICTGCLEVIPTCANCGETLDEDDETDDAGCGPCCREDDDTGEEEEEDSEEEDS